MDERRVAVADLGSNSFRLVVFATHPGGWWTKADEIHETVRLGGGIDESGELAPEPMARALDTIELFRAFCEATGVDEVQAVATSAIRDARNRDEVIERSPLPVRVLSAEEEAWYGYVAAANSTTVVDGAVLDVGGGSVQIVRVEERCARERISWPLGAVRMTERFLPGDEASKKQIKALRAHVRKQLADASWLDGGHLVGVGGSIRNLAAAAERARRLPFPGVQGFVLRRDALAELIGELASRPVRKRGSVGGIKEGRADIILAAAIVVDEVMDAGGFDGLEATEWGLREGVFLAGELAPADPPLVEDVRGAGVRNLATRYHGGDLRHPDQVRRLALELWDGLAAAGLHAGDPEERSLLGAAALLHDIGMAVNYDDHHKHSRYLIIRSGLPGYNPREVALLAQMARYHRKGEPEPDDLEPLLRRGDDALLGRCAAVLRVVEQLERARDGRVRDITVSAHDGTVELALDSRSDLSFARWAAERQGPMFERAFGRRLALT
jgi:exopolyphosphatase / guanosine-5'-triphosphate,3'-diphosphate pyrophosphatase